VIASRLPYIPNPQPFTRPRIGAFAGRQLREFLLEVEV
jgi:hypothetical protein